jgi:predicted phage terminase large subunit-like protein
MRVEAGEIPRLMVFMPPGSAKSTYGTVTFPTWFMGRRPGRHVITTSYGSELAVKFGRKCRQITGSRQYREVFGTGLNADNKAAHDWSIGNGSTFMAAGILAGITGNRADGLVIDDPLKGRGDADSETIRDKIWEEYTSSLRTRLKPGAFILIIQTRWHEDDLSGRILPKGWNGESGWVTGHGGERWYVLSLQAQCETANDPLGRKPGEWLWPEWFTPEHWAREKQIQGSRNWAALFQQRPTPQDGGIIKLPWFRRYGTPPRDGYMVVQSWDTAYKPDQINDPSVCTTWAVTPAGYYLLHVWRDRVGYPELKRTVRSLHERWKPDAVLIEDKASGQSLIQDLREATLIPVIAIEPEGDKLTRANVVSPLVEAGLVHLPRSGPSRWPPTTIRSIPRRRPSRGCATTPPGASRPSPPASAGPPSPVMVPPLSAVGVTAAWGTPTGTSDEWPPSDRQPRNWRGQTPCLPTPGPTRTSSSRPTPSSPRRVGITASTARCCATTNASRPFSSAATRSSPAIGTSSRPARARRTRPPPSSSASS